MNPIIPVHNTLRRRLPILAIVAWTGMAQAQQTIEKYVRYSAELVAAFAEADNNPANTYNVTLEWRRDSQGNTITWEPATPFRLTKGRVRILGSQSNNYPERYIFDGKGNNRLFEVVGATGFSPQLTLSGITVRNGYTSSGGGGLYASKADYIQIAYCRFLNNRSNLNGSGILVQTTRSLYVIKTLVDGNQNLQIATCGGGVTSAGGGIAYLGGGTDGYFSIHKSTISNNKACRGGGIQLNGNITMNMHNNTFSGNEAIRQGGAMILQVSNKPSYFYHNTITNNKAGTAGQITQEINAGGGVVFSSFNGTGYWNGNVIAKNQVVYQTTSITQKTEDCYVSSGSPAFVKHLNAVGRISNCSQLGTGGTWGVGTDASPFDPKLSSIALGTTNDGFSLPVHYPASNSPLRGNYFNPPLGGGYRCPSVDERGFTRKTNGCDIGSVERGADGNP